MSERVWVVDDTPSARFPIYTRGNVGEVFPDVVSPLSWSATAVRPSSAGETHGARCSPGWPHCPTSKTASDRGLLDVTSGFRPLFRHLYRRHILTTFRVFVGSGVLAQICEKKLGDPTLLAPLLSGIGSVESAEPSWAMWRLGRMAASDPAVAAVFEAGMDDIENRLEAEPAAAAFRQALVAFLDDFGSRGPNEWEGSSPTWGTAPRLALAAIDRMRVADASHDPHLQQQRWKSEREAATAAARARLSGPNRAPFDRAVRSTHLFSQGRERSKTTIIRAIHGLRLAQLELARRARERGGPDDLADMWLLAEAEMPDYVAAPEGFKAVIEERRHLRETLAGLVPPFVRILG